ncbi:MAG: rod-binding protein [Syntrophomonadaceae bacterium]|nr:rod-binding protein [Syntrophomonadaceae bacterium]MDD3888972.1 rod-binding protein [Syntrophomonadaceae bacterium]MDD4549709.1 rod-binding protein [Syntrophomonadaceae bacterium]
MKIDGNLLSMNAITKNQNLLEPQNTKEHFDRVLDSAVKEKNEQKLYKACQDLEGVFINKVLESMKNTIPYSDFVNRGFATETFESMLFQEYAQEISQTKSLGIADILFRQLNSSGDGS